MLKIFIFSTLLVASVWSINLPGVPVNFDQDDETLSAISREFFFISFHLIVPTMNFIWFTEEIADKFAEEYIQFMKTGVESTVLKQLSTQLAKTHSKKDMFLQSISDFSGADKFVMCTTCRAVTNVVAETFRAEDGELHGPEAEERAKITVLELCDRFQIQTPEVCNGLVELNWPILSYIIMNSLADARAICGTLPISFCKVNEGIFNWSVKVDNGKGLMTAPKSAVPKKTANDLNIVQITDIHYDPDYQPGSLAECDEPLCCRSSVKKGTSKEAQAGYWSDYRSCDSPLHMVEQAFDHIRETHSKIDYIYQTGDIVPHNVWTTTKDSNRAMLTEINDLLEEKFPGVQIFPSVGNHEPHPTNV